MDCPELLRLRAEATQLRKDLEDQRLKARTLANRPREGRDRRGTDFEGFLQRRIARAAAEIERHIASHQCQT